MTHFKLYLLTPQFRDNVTTYIEDQITEFYSQSDQDHSRAVKTIDKDGHTIEDNDFEYDDIKTQREELWQNNHNTFAYSYDEKLTKEQNAQKTLTFEMNRYISVANEWRENPFARNIMVGSTILLKEFRYREVSEETFFTVTNIKYNFQENNTIYSITCQDSFTYQSARQNEGYTIKNDPESSDFIGAKTIDWWIINKIMPECHMNYQYLSMQTGLYLTKQGHYYQFDINDKDNIQVPNGESILKIIKEPYSPEKDTDYFEKFSFSCSGSNANAALISLADLINFQLNTFEHARFNNTERSNVFDQFFWVEPKHNDQRLGLEYNPSQSIKSFNLTHKGESLTTVLDIVGPTVNEEVITLFPSIPPFFADVFLSGQLWDSSAFNTGFFSNICKGKLYLNYSNATADTHANIFSISLVTKTLESDDVPSRPLENTDEDYYSKYVIQHGLFYDDQLDAVCGWYDENTHFRYFPIYTEQPTLKLGVVNKVGDFYKNFLFNIPTLYNYISFTYNGNASRIIKGSAEDSLVFQNDGSLWELVLHDLDTNTVYIVHENLEANIFAYHNYRVFIRVRVASDVTDEQSWNNPSIYLRFYRNPSKEELSFAKIADTCPWLENKLIDFSYFYTNRFINESEYEALMDIMNNKLRIVNGKLLIYAQAYYNALHQETEILAKIQEKLDLLGAECQASIIDPCADSVAPSINLKTFKQTYLDVTSYNANNYTPILNHTTLLEEYFSKYFNAQQRFLKNVKAFRDFFDANVNFSAEGLYHYDLSIDLPNFINLLTEQGLPSDNEEHTTEVSFYSFANAQFNQVLSNFQYYIGYSNNGNDLEDLNNYGEPTVPIYKYIAGSGYSRMGIVSKRNYKNYYIAKIKAGTRYQIKTTLTEGDNENQLDGTYNNEKTYYQIVFRVPIVKNTNNNHWYLESDTQQKYKIGITNSLVWSKDPTVAAWQGFYRVRKYFTPTTSSVIWCVGDHIELDKTDNTKGVLVLKLLPIQKTTQIDAAWQEGPITSCYIRLCYFHKENGVWNIATYSTAVSDNTLNPDYQVITKEEAINNWLYYDLYQGRSGNYRLYYYHDSEMYHKLSSYALDASWANRNLAKGLIPNFAEGSEADIADPGNAWGDDGYGYNLYLKYFPITHYYYYGSKYKVVPQDNEGVYYFKRLNAKGQDQKDYYNALIGGEYVDSPYDYKEYQPITAVNKDNEGNFYRRIHGNATGKVWSGIATGLVSLAMWCIPKVGLALTAGSWALYHMLWKYGPTWFAKEGLCNKTFFNDYCEDTNTYSGWHNWSEIVYAIGEDSYTTYEKLTDAAVSANGDRTSINISHWNDSYYSYIGSDMDASSIYLYNTERLTNKHYSDNEISYPTIGNQTGITYNGAKAEGLYYKYTNGRFLTLEHQIRKNGNYKIIWWTNEVMCNGNYQDFISKAGTIFDLVEYYPIANGMLPLEVSNLDWESEDSYPLGEILSDCGYSISSWNNSNYIFRVSCNSGDFPIEGIISFVSIEDYNSRYLSDNIDEFLTTYPIKIYSNTNKVYDANDVAINFDKIKTLMTGYFYVTDKDSDFIRIGDMDTIPEYNKSETYYDAYYKRAYTMYELINERPFVTYYLQCQSYTEELLSSDVTTFTPILVKNTALVRYQVEEDQIKYSIDSFTSSEDRNLYTIDFQNSNILDIDIDDITIHIGLEKRKVGDIKGLTNGAFWYKYHTSLDHPLLLQQAAVIESQLSQYWQTAYIASKYCEYFLPEHWQPVYDTKTNNFASALFVIKYGHDNKSLSITVNNKLIPDVNVVRNERNEVTLPRYQFKRLNRQISYMPDSAAGQYIDELNTHLAVDYLSDNAAVVNAMKIINDSLDNWYVEENGTETYYYAEENTGMLWNKFLLEATKVSYDFYSGIYVMLYRILKEQYRELPMSEYTKYQKQHDHLWNILHNKYQFMILENSYTNENATSSLELLQMAQYAFKSRINPEAEYSIAVLHTSELKDYYGQEIRIGDGIKIDAQQYYNEYDQIYRSLSQYLFVSKITYSLRNPIDISLTVNDVQYEDKLVQRLVKLMK